MAAAIYPKWKQLLMDIALNGASIPSGTVKAALVTSGYTYSATHQFLSSVGANTLGTAVVLTSITTDQPSAGVFDCDNLTFTSVPSGEFVAVLYYIDTGNVATSPLVYYDDAVSGFPGSVTNGTVNVDIDSGANRLFKL